MSSYARLVLLIGTPFVVLAFIGAVYLQIWVGGRATRDAWILTRDVSPGAQLTSDTVERVRVGAQGTPFLLYTGDPVKERQRAGHAMKASHLLAPDDLVATSEVLAPASFAAAPTLHRGDSVDVYVSMQGRVVEVGRYLTVESPTAIWVPAGDERYWVALEANRASMIAVRSSGAAAPASDVVTLQEALAALTGGAATQLPTIPSQPSR